MALTRKLLEDLGLDGEAVDKAINAHLETVNAHLETVNALKADKEKLEKQVSSIDENALKLNIESLKKQVEELNGTKSEYEKYKQEVQAEKTRTAKVNKLTEMLKAEKVYDALIPLFVKSANIDNLELTDNGEFSNNPIDTLKQEYSALFTEPKVTESGTQTTTPPQSTNNKDDDLFLKGFKNEN